jgi:hypothetical protein
LLNRRLDNQIAFGISKGTIAMRRTSAMTLGIVLVFIGLQLNLVDTYVLTPRFSNFFSANGQSENLTAFSPSTNLNQVDNGQFGSPFQQASYSANSGLPNQLPTATNGLPGPRPISPPSWLCWPVLFLGTVVFLHGLSMERD